MEVVSLVFADIPVVAGLQTWKCYMGEPELFQAVKKRMQVCGICLVHIRLCDGR